MEPAEILPSLAGPLVKEKSTPPKAVAVLSCAAPGVLLPIKAISKLSTLMIALPADDALLKNSGWSPRLKVGAFDELLTMPAPLNRMPEPATLVKSKV